MFRGPTFTYELNAVDVDWLARALYGELRSNVANDRAAGAVAWTMMQRWMRMPSAKKFWPTFTDFMRAFSQPINPAWADPNSSKVLAAPASAKTPEKMEFRKWLQTVPIESIDPVARLAAKRFRAGELPNPVPSAIDFAAAALVESKGLVGTNIWGNVFLTPYQYPSSIKWKRGLVTHVPSPPQTPSILWAVLTAGLIGVIVVSAFVAAK